MSLQKIGFRTPPSSNGHHAEHHDEALGIPGHQRPALFYQDKRVLPTVSHGEGIYIYDKSGKKYLDGCSGAIAATIGHGNERVNRRAAEQMAKISFAYRTQFESEPANQLADLLVRLAPPEINRVFFVNSGSEAVEASIKLARQYWWAEGHHGKSMVISRVPSYHGATLGALSCTEYAPLNIPFRSQQLHFPKVSHPYCYHCPLRHEYPSCNMACAHELEQVIRLHGAENIAAFICEPIGGASTGAAVPPEEYFPIVERICHEHNILLIMDDVLTGCGRTGTFYGFEHWDITPDIVALSKGLSGGYTPIGACLASEEVVRPVLDSGGFMHGHTYAGNPLSTAVAHEVVKVIIEENLTENARVVGTYLHERLWELKGRFPIIGDVRGRGLLAGVEFVRDRALREPFPAKWAVALEATEIAREYGLLIYPRRSLNGLTGDHVLVCPPLIITREQVDEMMDLFEKMMVDLMKLLERYVNESAAVEPDGTVERFRAVEPHPPIVYEEISLGPGDPEANQTGAMQAAGFEVSLAPDEDEDYPPRPTKGSS